MCEVTTATLLWASLAASAASTAVAYTNQQKTAKVQAQSIEQEQQLQQQDLVRQRDQQRSADAGAMNEQARRALADAALFDVVTGEYGGGNTANRGMAVLGVQSGESLAVLDGNAETAASEGGFRSAALASQSASRLASISRPSGLGSILTIASSAAGAYGQNQQQQALIRAQQKGTSR